MDGADERIEEVVRGLGKAMTPAAADGYAIRTVRHEDFVAAFVVGREEVEVGLVSLRYAAPHGLSISRAQHLFMVRVELASLDGVSTEAGLSTKRAMTGEVERTASTAGGIKFQKRKS